MLPRLREQKHDVPQGARAVGYYERVPLVGVPTYTTTYLPGFQEYLWKVQDESHRSCYPHCGGPYMVYKVQTSYGPFSCYHGYDYIVNGKHNKQVYAGGYVKPYVSFGTVPEVAESGVRLNPFTGDDPIDQSNAPSGIQSIGERAYNRFRPQLERFNFFESIRELPETISLLKLRSKKMMSSQLARSPEGRMMIANEAAIKRSRTLYLEYQFGWVPLLKDVKKLVDTVVNCDTYINKLVKNNGSWCRRGGVVDDNSKQVVTKLNNSTAYYVPGVGVPQEIWHTVSWKTQSRFVGMFRYYVPGIDRSSFAGRFTAASILLGMRPTPATLYHACPWTWLADWATGAGDWVDNYSSTTADDCACKYAWVSTVTEASSCLSVNVRTTFATPTVQDVSIGAATGTSEVKYQKKSRYGYQYAFSFGAGPLDERRAAILHALVYAKSPKLR